MILITKTRTFFSDVKKTSIKQLISRNIRKVIIKIDRDRDRDNIGITAIYKNEYISRQILLNDFYEHEILIELKKITNILNIDKNLLCLDIGANIGNHSNFLSKYFKKIIAFEPHPLNFLLLSANAFNIPAISVHNKACGSSNHTASITTLDKDNMGGSELNESQHGEHKVEVVKLDDAISAPVSFIKIDVEGHELDVIKGALNTITTHRPVIAFEANPDFGKPSQVYDLLKSVNYKFVFRQQVNISPLGRLFNILLKGHKISKVDYIIGDPSLNEFHNLVLAVHNNKFQNAT